MTTLILIALALYPNANSKNNDIQIIRKLNSEPRSKKK